MEATVKHVVSWGEKDLITLHNCPEKEKKIMKKLTWPKAKSLLDGHIFRTFCFNVKQYFVAEKINIPYTANVYRSCRFSLWKRAVRTTKKFYTPERERLVMLWRNPVMFTDCYDNHSFL